MAKKYLVAFLLFVFNFTFISPCLAYNELYYLQNSNKKTITANFEKFLGEKKYSIVKTNPYYAVSDKDPSIYSSAVFQQDGNNLYYYFETNSKSKKLNKTFLNSLKENGITLYQLENPKQVLSFSQVAQKAIYGSEKNYSFDEPETLPVNKIEQKPLQEKEALTGYIKKVGRGQELNIYIQDPINTATANIGDSVIGILKEDWVTQDNKVIAPQGSVLYGELTKAHPAQYGMRNGYVQISFYKLLTPDGNTYDISTKQIDFHVTNEGKVKRTVTSVVSSAAVGALVGLLGGLMCGNSSSMLKGAAIGAGIGGGMSMISSTTEKGIDAEIPALTDIDVVLQNDINVLFND